MIRVTVEVIPFGDEDQAREIGRVEIVNQAPFGVEHATYEAVLSGEIGDAVVGVEHQRSFGALPLLAATFHRLRGTPPRITE